MRAAVMLLLLLLAVGFAGNAQDERAGAARPGSGRGHVLGSAMRSASAAPVPTPARPRSARSTAALDLDAFMDRLREGLMVDHPDMPTFRFAREDARAFVLYICGPSRPPEPQSKP